MALSKNAVMLLKDRYCQNETPKELFKRVAGALSVGDSKFENKLYRAMIGGFLMPASPTLRGAGHPNALLHPCAVLGVKDNIESIFETIKNTALLFHHGAGVGISFNPLRPKGDPLSSGGYTSGVLSFMEIFDKVVESVKEGGFRKGGVLGVLNCLSGDSKIATLKGEVDIKKLVGKRPYLYSVDSNLEIHIQQASKIFCKGERELYRIYFDDGSNLDTTEDHLICLHSGKYKKTVELEYGDSLAHFHRGLYRTRSFFNLWINSKNPVQEHVAVAELKYRCNLRHTSHHGLNVHHVDENPLNNSIENIELLTRSAHAKKHAHNLDKYRDKLYKLRKGKTYEEIYGKEKAEKIKAKMKGKRPWNKKLSSDEYKDHYKSGFKNQFSNFKVIRVEKLKGTHKVYDVIMPKYHNFVANKVVVHNCDHPEILNFITYKLKDRLTNMNNSVMVTDDFMQKVEKNERISLVNPRDKSVWSRVGAKDLFDLIAFSAHCSGDPGLLFYDRINKDNPLYPKKPLTAANLCSELPLFENLMCNLTSINLSKFVKGNSFDTEKFAQYVELGTRTLLNINGCSWYPTAEITRMMKKFNPIGLGLCGMGDLLIKLGIYYDSEEHLKLIDEIKVPYIEITNRMASKSFYKRSLPPTGSVSILLDASPATEPIFDASFERHLSIGVIRETRELYKSKYLRIAHDVSSDWRLKIQAKWQNDVIDSGISSTVNLPSSTTVDEIKRIFMKAWKLGLKGVCVFRDGCKEGVLQRSKCAEGSKDCNL